MDEFRRLQPLDLSIRCDLEVSGYPQIDYESGLRFVQEVAQAVQRHWGVEAVPTDPPAWKFETGGRSPRLSMNIARGDCGHDEEVAEVARAIVDRNRNKP